MGGYCWRGFLQKFTFSFQWVSCALVVVSSFAEAYEGSQDTMHALALGTAIGQFLVMHLILVSRRSLFEDIVTHLRTVFHDIKEYPGSIEIVGVSGEQTRRFIMIFGVLIFSNLPSGMIFAAIKMILTGEPAYPFPMSIFGLPSAIGWVLQLVVIAHASNLLWTFHSILKTHIYILGAYSDVLALMLRERPIDVDAKNDRRILKLFCDINSISSKLGNVYDLSAFIEVSISSGRCCFLAVHILLQVQEGDYKNLAIPLDYFLVSVAITYSLCSCGEDITMQSATIRDGVRDSKWYAVSPPARRTLLSLLVFTKSPIQFHYKRFVNFNLETFRDVMKTAYTMTTALASML